MSDRMQFTDWLSIISIIVTVGATAVTIGQAASAAKSSKAAQAAMATIRSAEIAARLRSAQEHIRTLPSVQDAARGGKFKPKLDRIRQEFDNVLGALPKEGEGSRARVLVASAQANLNTYEVSLSTTLDRAAWQSLQTAVQDAISELTTAAVQTGKTSND